MWALGLRRRFVVIWDALVPCPPMARPEGGTQGKLLGFGVRWVFCFYISLSDICYSQYMEGGGGGENPPFRRISLFTFEAQPHTDRVFQPSPGCCDGDIPGWPVTPPEALCSLPSGPDPGCASLSSWADGPLLTTGILQPHAPAAISIYSAPTVCQTQGEGWTDQLPLKLCFDVLRSRHIIESGWFYYGKR